MSKQPSITIGPDERPRLDHNRRFALAYRRAEDRVEYLAFDAYGLQRGVLTAEEFASRFRGRLIPDVPLDRTAADLLARAGRDYLPNFGVYPLLKEIFVMAATEGTGDLGSLGMKDLMAKYNLLAKTRGLPPVKEFKSKGVAVERIEALLAEAEPTDQQKKRKASGEAAPAPGAKAFDQIANGQKPARPSKKDDEPAAEKPAGKTAAAK